MNPIYEIKHNQIGPKVFDSKLFQDYLKSKFTALLGQFLGDLFFATDEESFWMINQAVGGKILTENGVKATRKLDQLESIPKEYQQILFFVSPQMKYLKKVEKIIKSTREGDLKENARNYNIIFWPKRTTLCLEALETLGILGSFSDIKDFSFDLVPLEYDLLSLEMTSWYREYLFNGDMMIYQQVAESIQRIQSVYGKIPNVFVKGDAGKTVLNILKNNEKQLASSEQSVQQNQEIEALIILDRQVDLITPLLKQLIYEGYIDDFFGISGFYVDIPGSILQKKEDFVKMKLSGGDTNYIYENLRGLNVPDGVRNFLSQEYSESKKVQEYFDSKPKKLTVDELEVLTTKVKLLNEYKPIIETHFSIFNNVTERIATIQHVRDLKLEQRILAGSVEQKEAYEYLEVLMAMNASLQRVLKLIALVSLVNGGWKPSIYEDIRKDLSQAYGFDSLVGLNNLAKNGLFKKQDKQLKWEDILEKFKLINYSVNTSKQEDVSYFYSGYIPILIRYVEEALRKQSWKEFAKINMLIPGEMDYPAQYQRLPNNQPRVVIVYAIGGLTYGEISALRFLSKQLNIEILIATTNIINTTKLLKLFEPDVDQLILRREEDIL